MQAGGHAGCIHKDTILVSEARQVRPDDLEESK